MRIYTASYYHVPRGAARPPQIGHASHQDTAEPKGRGPLWGRGYDLRSVTWPLPVACRGAFRSAPDMCSRACPPGGRAAIFILGGARKVFAPRLPWGATQPIRAASPPLAA